VPAAPRPSARAGRAEPVEARLLHIAPHYPVREPVTHVLLDRGREPDGLARGFTISVAVHVVLLAGLVIADWTATGRSTREDNLQPLMMISLGGAPGPASGGMTPMGGRPIQQTVPLSDAKRPEPVRPPAAKTPEMTVPEPAARPRPAPATPVRTAPEEARGRTPTRGAETRAGSAIAETGAQGLGFGLSTGGGGTGGQINVGDFCCPEYLKTMLDLIRRNWNDRQGVSAVAIVRFTIERDGTITDVTVQRSSGYPTLDLTAQRALLTTRQIPPLPSTFTPERLTVHLTFEYQ
jgi:periplasmic protein TonB